MVFNKNKKNTLTSEVVAVILVFLVFLIIGLILGGVAFSVEVFKNIILGTFIGAAIKIFLLLLSRTGIAKNLVKG